MQLPIVTDGISSSEPHHTQACIATSVCIGNIQNIQTIIRPYKTNIKMGKDLNVHTNVRGYLGMVEQYRNMEIIIQLCETCMYNRLTASRTNTLAGS